MVICPGFDDQAPRGRLESMSAKCESLFEKVSLTSSVTNRSVYSNLSSRLASCILRQDRASRVSDTTCLSLSEGNPWYWVEKLASASECPCEGDNDIKCRPVGEVGDIFQRESSSKGATEG